ncbi:hypothetical protein [Streptomyces microflavus]|uniref:hypothetical protein n=1 Tax=Streptomyces microflavus TaxID=1919 RepID=UPI0036BA1EF0
MPITHVDSNTSPSSFPGASSNTDTCAVLKPDGLAADDVMVAWIQAGGVTMSSAPSGWTLVHTRVHADANLTSWVYYKVATGSEPASYTWTASAATTPMGGAISAFRGVDTANPINAQTSSESAATQTVSTPSVTSTNRALILHFRLVSTAYVAGIGTFNPPTITRRFLVGNRGASTQYYSELYTNGTTIVNPGSQSGTSFTGVRSSDGTTNINVVRSIQRTIALREYEEPSSGSFSGTLGALTGSMSAAASHDGPLAGSLSALTGSFAGTHFVPAEGTVVAVLPALTAAVTAAMESVGSMSAALPPLAADIAADSTYGPLVATLPALTADIVLETRPFGPNVLVVARETRRVVMTE